MSNIHLIIPDAHAQPNYNNNRADLLSRLIIDVQPDVVVNMGDQWDFPSLCSYDKGLRRFQGRSYKADVDSGLEFSDRLWGPVKKRKKRLPRRVFLEGNHERRIEKALDLTPELTGTVSFNDLDLNRDYDDVVRYTGRLTPGTISIDGVTYAHFLVSGVLGRPIGGEHSAYSLVTKHFTSCTVAHSHVLDFCIRTDPHGRRVQGLVSGCLVDYESDWAGEAQRLWHTGVVICRGVNSGQYDLEVVSLDRLRREYS